MEEIFQGFDIFAEKSIAYSSVALGARVILIPKKMSKNFEPTSHAKGVALKHHHYGLL